MSPELVTVSIGVILVEMSVLGWREQIDPSVVFNWKRSAIVKHCRTETMYGEMVHLVAGQTGHNIALGLPLASQEQDAEWPDDIGYGT